MDPVTEDVETDYVAGVYDDGETHTVHAFGCPYCNGWLPPVSRSQISGPDPLAR